MPWQCDETKPQCLRCQKYGRECPGTPQAKPSAFRWRYKTYDPAEDSNASDAPSSRKGSLPRTGESISACAELESTAISFWLENLIKDNFYASYVQTVYESCSKPSAMSHIVAAAAVDLYARHEGTEKRFALASLRHYHDALQALRGALEDPHLAQQNETVAAVLLIMAWESHTIHHRSVRQMEPQQRHNVGAMTLLRNRGSTQFEDPLSLTVFRQSRNHTVSY